MLKLDFIYSKTYNFVYLRAKSILKKEDDILQLMKEVYLHAVAHADEISEDNLYEWLGKQTYILGCSKYRRKKVREAEIIELGKQEYVAQKNVDRETTKEVIRESLGELPDMYQATLYAFYYDYMKLKEISSVMGYSTKAIMNRLNYTHKYLCKALENYREEQDNKVNVQFSVEVVLETLREWSAANRLGMTVAQNVYAGICRELGVQSEGVEFKENELAGANNRIVEHGSDSMNVICEELEAHSSMPVIGKKQMILIGAAAIAFVAMVLAVVLLLGKGEKDDEPKNNQQITQEQEEEESNGPEADADINTDTNVDANADTDADEGVGSTVDLETNAEPENEEPEKPAISEPEYILPNSNTVKLTRDDLSGLSKEQLRLARNEIFARHGMIFGVADLDNYFGSKSWYQPSVTYDDFYDKVEMNLIEEANVALILDVEAEME